MAEGDHGLRANSEKGVYDWSEIFPLSEVPDAHQRVQDIQQKNWEEVHDCDQQRESQAEDGGQEAQQSEERGEQERKGAVT